MEEQQLKKQKEEQLKRLLNAVEEEMHFLGIDKGCKGVKAILEVLKGKKEFEELTNKEHEQIVDAWDSRNCTPASIYRRFRPVAKTPECSNEDLNIYNKNVSKNVLIFFSQPAA